MILRLSRLATVFAALLLYLFAPPAFAAEVTLLIPGMDRDLERDDASALPGATRWSATIDYLQARGMRYGGLVSAARQDTTNEPPTPGDLYALRFSAGASTDGIGLKALEISRAIEMIRGRTGAQRVNLVAYSAGGLAARLYLQDALAGVAYRHDVERLITVATPHLGAAIANGLGDLLGTRATSLKPDADIVRVLNVDRPLPADVRYAAIVVRGLGADIRGKGEPYDGLSDPRAVAAMPEDLLVGGDQVVHMRSQNLALSRAAAGYERRNGRPILYLLARVPDPSPEDHWFSDAKVHEVALDDAYVQELLWTLLRDDRAWDGNGAELREGQLRRHALGLAEAAFLARRPWARITDTGLQSFEMLDGSRDAVRFRYAAQVETHGYLMRAWRRQRRVHGEARCGLDGFGRIRRCEQIGATSVQ